MALIDFIKRLSGGASIQKKEASVPLFSRLLSVVSRSSAFYGGKDPADCYEGWVFSCVRAIAEQVADIDLRLYRMDKQGHKEQVMDHPAITSIQNVNDFFTKYTLFERLQSNLELEGSEYWFLQPAENGQFEIYPLVPKFISPVLDPFDYVSGYKYNLDNKVVLLNKDQIIHFRNFNPKSDVIGKSTLSAAMTAVETDDGAKNFNKNFFHNSGLPTVVLEYPQSLEPEEIQKLKRQWNDEYGGAQNSGKTAVASDGLKITTLNTSQKDMDYIEGRRFSRDEILAIFRVPKIAAGIMEDVNRASAEAAMYAFILWTILPKMKRIVGTLNEFYLPLFGDSTLRFECATKPPEDKAQMTQYYTSGINNGWLSPNEVRRMEGLPEVADGNKLYLPLSLIDYSKVEEVSKSLVPEKDIYAKGIESIGSTIQKALAESTGQKKKDDFEKRGESKNRQEVKRRLANERLMAKTSKSLFDDQKKRAIAGLKDYLKSKGVDVEGFNKYDRVRMLKAKKIPLLDYDNEMSVTIDLFRPVIEKIVKEEGVAALAYLGVEDAFDLNSRDIQSFLKKSTEKLATSMTDTTIESLNDSILEGLEEGEAISGLTARISDATAFDAARSERIARTETTRSSAQAEIAAWDQTGLVASLVWWTAQDERVDDECALLHGVEVGIGKAFVSPSELDDLGEDDYMGNGIDSPPRHPNCRCTILPILK